MAEKRYALIPAYKPDKKLIKITVQLIENGYSVVVVDDGSGPEYADIFYEILPYVELLIHEVNKGKGAAIKTGLEFIAEDGKENYTVVTLDADGQHSIEDVIRVTEVAEKEINSLILGVRGFDKNVPIRSRLGNVITRCIFLFVTGIRIQDTQTGLRAFSDKQVEFMRSIAGERYEYEINVLLEYTKGGMLICQIPIETIYLDNNNSSHFHVIRDSVLIYAQILKHMDVRMERRGAGW